MDGIGCIDKPFGPTSAAVARDVQRRLGAAKAGHAGTLDPAATGVLVLLLGEATKLSSWLMDCDKEYLAVIRFGTSTDTLDAQGTVCTEAPVPAGALEEAALEQALAGLVGEVDQMPPVYSAIKRDGRTLMARARAGEEVQVSSRRVMCHGLALRGRAGNEATVHVHCGKGYYVRSLARDLGVALGLPAHLASLRRTRVGRWCVDEAVSPEAIELADLLPLGAPLPGIPLAVLDGEETRAALDGKATAAVGDARRAVLVDGERRPIAMGERTDDDKWRIVRGLWHPMR